MNFKGIIFDLDGVICHTDQYHYKAWKTVADKLNIPFTQQINNRLRGVSRMESLEIILEQSSVTLTQQQKDDLAKEKNDLYREMLKEMTPQDVTDEVRDALKELSARGCLLAIGSSSKNARFILEKIDCTKYFDAICDGSDITRSKPDPEVFSLAGTRLHLVPKECAVVEDAVAGVKAAVAAGMTPIAIGDAAVANACELKISSLSEILNLL